MTSDTGTGLSPNPPIFNPLSNVRPDLPREASIPGVFWVEGAKRNITTNSISSTRVSATDQDTAQEALMTSYFSWTYYDDLFNDLNINNDVQNRFVWTQGGPNPQDSLLNAKLSSSNFPSGVYKVTFFANDGIHTSKTSAIYYSIDNPSTNERPYITEIPSISLDENDQVIINLDDYGFDPDRNINTLGRITYNIVSAKPDFTHIKLCGKNPLTNNLNHILTIAPVAGDTGGLDEKDIFVTIRATDNSSPRLFFDRTFKLTLFKESGNQIIINKSNLPNCFTNPPVIEDEDIDISPDTVKPIAGLDPTLNPDSAPIAVFTSLPKVFNPSNLNIPEIIKAIKGNNISQNEIATFLNRKIGSETFKNTLIVGGRAYIGVKLSPDVSLRTNELKSLNYLLVTKLDNAAHGIIAKDIFYSEKTKDLLLEVQLPDNIPPGDATLLINKINNDKPETISRVRLTILPSLFAASKRTQKLFDKPLISQAILKELPTKKGLANKKYYRLVLSGHNFIGKKVVINNKVINSPIQNQPFSLITFTNNKGITIQNIRVNKAYDKIKILLEIDQGLLNSNELIKYFTLSTIVGQVTSKINLNEIHRIIKKGGKQ